MDVWLEEMEVVQERMGAKIEANNEKFEVLQGTLVSGRISTKPGQGPIKEDRKSR
jgi:hypothetical protein